MNREIKFRVWDGDNPEGNTMHYTSALKVYENCLVADFEFKPPHYQNNDGSVIMQFTGMKDKEGKEIYEGDIIASEQWNPMYYKVIFEDGEFCFISMNESERPYTNQIHYVKHFKVVGNIYETPELIEKP